MYTIDFQKPIHVHFIGIGGISMSGLAEILLNRHFTVTGSDMQSSDMTKHLEETGAKVVIGQKAENITDDIDLVVYTAAIHESNEEFAAAKNKGIPMMTRAALLGQIMANFAKSIAVAGTHGKTTTTSMLTHILLQADTDPTVSVGGMLDRIGGNIRVGHSDLFLTEACEYTNSFLEFYPLYSIILNVEEDHMDFFKDLDDMHSPSGESKTDAEIQKIKNWSEVVKKEWDADTFNDINMKVVLLAGGFGSRISEESQIKPKPMIEIGGMPILWHIMKEYSYFGHNEFIICAGYKQEYIKEWFSKSFSRNCKPRILLTRGKRVSSQLAKRSQLHGP